MVYIHVHVHVHVYTYIGTCVHAGVLCVLWLIHSCLWCVLWCTFHLYMYMYNYAYEYLYIVQVVSRRDCGRGDTVAVNGARHTLDLVALIAYFKLKKKCQGTFKVCKASHTCTLL